MRTILKAIARTLFVTAWADHEEEKGVSFSGKDLFACAPAHTPLAAFLKAEDLGRQIARMNGLDPSLPSDALATLFERACEADKALAQSVAPSLPVLPQKGFESLKEEFGHYLAMQSLGSGATWFDDHAEFPLEVPLIEFSFYSDDAGNDYPFFELLDELSRAS